MISLIYIKIVWRDFKHQLIICLVSSLKIGSDLLKRQYVMAYPASVYQELPACTVRLLVLLPGAGKEDLKANFQLRYLGNSFIYLNSSESRGGGVLHLSTPCALDDSTKASYEALSYTWGASLFPQQIICHGFPIPITQNLFDALIHLRNAESPRLLWVDAVCINQQNDGEKSSQIPIMKDIYAKASCVLIWLGIEDQYSNQSLSAMKTVIKGLNDLGEKLDLPIWSLLGEETDDQLWALLPLPHNDSVSFLTECIVPIQKFLERSWFSRVWTIQEARVAKTAKIIIGNSSLDWGLMGIAILHLTMKTHSLKIPVPWNMTTAIEMCLCSRSHSQSSFMQDGLQRLLLETKIFESSDPRDKIYALLGLATNDLGIRPDYNASVEEVFTDTTRRLIFKENTVRFPVSILSEAQRGDDGQIDTFPSWVPLWHLTSSSTLSIASKATAGGERKQKDLSLDPKVLVLEGFVVGTIKSSTETPENGDHWALRTKGYINFVVQILQLVGPLNIPYVNGDSLLKVIAKVLTAGGGFGENYFLYDFDRKVHLFLNNPSVPEADKIDCRSRIHDLRRRIQDAILDLQDFAKDSDTVYEPRFYAAINRRRVFCLYEGFLGLGPNSLQEEDIVCVLYDARQPFILRKIDDCTFRFIGECYLHGIMDGEALEEGQKRTQTFVIR